MTQGDMLQHIWEDGGPCTSPRQEKEGILKESCIQPKAMWTLGFVDTCSEKINTGVTKPRFPFPSSTSYSKFGQFPQCLRLKFLIHRMDRATYTLQWD
jgi:hypothetical protein